MFVIVQQRRAMDKTDWNNGNEQITSRFVHQHRYTEWRGGGFTVLVNHATKCKQLLCQFRQAVGTPLTKHTQRTRGNKQEQGNMEILLQYCGAGLVPAGSGVATGEHPCLASHTCPQD